MVQFGPTAVASGKSWMAQVQDQQAGLIVQRRIAGRIAKALNGKVYGLRQPFAVVSASEQL
jgi:hypothetical protein